MAPAAAAPSAAVPTAASGATQASSNFFTGKKSLGSLFHVSVAFYMHLIKSPKRNSHCSPLQVKDTSNDVSGYAKFSNAQNASTICASTSSLHTSSIIHWKERKRCESLRHKPIMDYLSRLSPIPNSLLPIFLTSRRYENHQNPKLLKQSRNWPLGPPVSLFLLVPFQ